MAKKKGNNTSFVVGSVLGGLIGAAAALWKTPMSGAELREKLGLGGADTSRVTTPVLEQSDVRPAETGASLPNRMLSKVENVLAPVVGVNLGQTANGSRGAESTATFSRGGFASTDADEYPGAAPANLGEEPENLERTPGAPDSDVTNVSDDADAFASQPVAASEDEAVSVETLTTPQVDVAAATAKLEGEMKFHPFPQLGGLEDERRE